MPWRDVTSIHMEQLRAAFGGKCQRCGGRWSLANIKDKGYRHRPLEFAHKKPTRLRGRGRGLQKRFRDILRNPDCYELLCKKCHWIKDTERSETALASGWGWDRLAS